MLAQISPEQTRELGQILAEHPDAAKLVQALEKAGTLSTNAMLIPKPGLQVWLAEGLFAKEAGILDALAALKAEVTESWLSSAHGNYTLGGSVPTNFASGQYTYYAVATDTANVSSAVSSAALSIAPLIFALVLFGFQPGRITNLTAAAGQYAAAGTALTMFVPDDLWGAANFKETQLDDMRPGQTVTIDLTKTYVAHFNTTCGDFDVTLKSLTPTTGGAYPAVGLMFRDSLTQTAPMAARMLASTIADGVSSLDPAEVPTALAAYVWDPVYQPYERLR